MRKVVYSAVTKVIAFILAVACIVLGAGVMADTFVRYENEERQVYDFEASYDQTSYFSHMLREPAYTVSYAINSFVQDSSDKSLYFHIEDHLKQMQYSDKVKYLIIVNGVTSTNCWEDKEYFENARFSVEIGWDKDDNVIVAQDYLGKVSYALSQTSLSWLNDDFEIYACIDEAYAQECELIWEAQRDYIWDAIIMVLALLGGAIIMTIYLMCVCGKRPDGEIRAIWLDSIWTEIHIAVIVFTIFLAELLIHTGFIEFKYFNWGSAQDLIAATMLAAGVVGALIINSALSLVRKLKCGKFLGTSVAFIVLKWLCGVLWRLMCAIGRGVKRCARLLYSLLTKKSGLLTILVIIVYTAIALICGVLLTDDDTALVGIIIGLISLCFVCLVLAYRGRELGSVSDGVEKIKDGTLTHNIPELRSSDMNRLAQDINEIAQGLDQSVAAKVRAERMKTELITNVSHDLKTPLTSIINYTELLSNVDGLPEEARDYVQIIAKKSDRLKRLTQDLFDISKIQSGNEEITLGRIDISLLVEQSLGEHDGEIKKSELTFCTNLENELYILADGHKMSRVISNLMSNALKYAMKNTRVFVTVATQGDNAVIEFKNTSAYPMDFDSQEIMGRFVRGDKSRSVEGNGLGLAIVHSYTEACGGRFEIVTDGDLFKAIISFPKIK